MTVTTSGGGGSGTGAGGLASGKMAALCTGTSYGLSNLRANDNKELIFVKLTDSAFRAIEEYNRNKVSHCAMSPDRIAYFAD